MQRQLYSSMAHSSAGFQVSLTAERLWGIQSARLEGGHKQNTAQSLSRTIVLGRAALEAAILVAEAIAKNSVPSKTRTEGGRVKLTAWFSGKSFSGLFSRVPLQGLAWAALFGNAVVILQGAFVRATGAGAGCGSHWPTCNGDIIPLNGSIETFIEFSHRLLSFSVLMLGLWILLRAFVKRKSQPGFFVFSTAAFFFLIVEALLGLATVRLELTGDTVSTLRGVMVAIHLVNSLLLIGTLTLTVVYARASARHKTAPWPLRLQRQPAVATVLLVGLLGMLVLIFSGGIAALGNTMFPSESLRAGLAADFDPASHIFIRLRLLHPVIAVTVGIYLFLSLGLSRLLKPVPEAGRLAQVLFGVYIAQLAIGTANLAFLAPVVLQLLHLGTAVLAFALLTALSAYTLGFEAAPRVARAPLQRASE